jgi:hypothetical protein
MCMMACGQERRFSINGSMGNLRFIEDIYLAGFLSPGGRG